MSYYKKNGFFDRLERLSDWIDDSLGDIPYLLNGNLWTWYRYTGIKRFDLLDDLECFAFDLKAYEVRAGVYQEFDSIRLKTHKEITDLYNREKYWWMARK